MLEPLLQVRRPLQITRKFPPAEAARRLCGSSNISRFGAVIMSSEAVKFTISLEYIFLNFFRVKNFIWRTAVIVVTYSSGQRLCSVC
jgi:hypothetical protein